MQSKLHSYTAASTFPVKVLQDKELLDEQGRIRPRHLQLSITNRCNLKCTFCSCSERTKGDEMEIEKVQEIIEKYKYLGCVAVTITGGGEPLMHPHINGIISVIAREGLKIGLVTNGLLTNLLTRDSIEKLDWVRISFDDTRDFREVTQPLRIVPITMADWSFSYVVSGEPNIKKICEVVEFANSHNFTHVRVVSDLLNVECVPNMSEIRDQVSARVDDSLVIYQGRKDYTFGSRKCYISLLKPVVNTDGRVYPCCGAQYAQLDAPRAYNGKMCMGDTNNIGDIFNTQAMFNGKACKKCYYSEYNDVLEALVTSVNHREFV